MQTLWYIRFSSTKYCRIFDDAAKETKPSKRMPMLGHLMNRQKKPVNRRFAYSALRERSIKAAAIFCGETPS